LVFRKEDHMQESILTPNQYKDLSKKIIHAVDTRYRIIPLNSLKHPKYHLKAPVYITLEFEDEKVIASFDDIEAFSYADTASEAIDLLCEEIIQIYEELNEDQENLGPLPNKWFHCLEDIIECR
jgi:hypothetical protein